MINAKISCRKLKTFSIDTVNHSKFATTDIKIFRVCSTASRSDTHWTSVYVSIKIHKKTNKKKTTTLDQNGIISKRQSKSLIKEIGNQDKVKRAKIIQLNSFNSNLQRTENFVRITWVSNYVSFILYLNSERTKESVRIRWVFEL